MVRRIASAVRAELEHIEHSRRNGYLVHDDMPALLVDERAGDRFAYSDVVGRLTRADIERTVGIIAGAVGVQVPVRRLRFGHVIGSREDVDHYEGFAVRQLVVWAGLAGRESRNVAAV